MEKYERHHKIIQLLKNKKSVAKVEFLERLEISEATFKRDIEYLRDRMGAPITWDRATRGYRLDNISGENQSFELPGIWFNASELQALLIMEFLLENLQPGLLGPHLKPLKSQINDLMEKGDHTAEEVARRIKFLPLASRDYDLELFGVVSSALLSRKKLKILYHNREKDEITERQISPQRLVLYRDNWYLDTWCHLRKGLRTFALEAINTALILSDKVKEISEKRLNEHLASSYGIYSGKPNKTAKLKFTPLRSRWVSSEKWHPKQKAYFDAKGYFYLEIPYRNETELIMDILKFGNDVEVIKPKTLRDSIFAKLKASLQIYS